MKSCVFGASLLVAAAFAAPTLASDITQVNGVNVQNRVFNDYPTSVLTPNMAYPGMVAWNEVFPQDGSPQRFANKHLAYLSTDGGATQYQHWVGQGFTIDFSARVNGSLGPAPRKEGMLQIENPRPLNNPPYVDEGHVLLGSEGEVAVFGGVMPFFSCRVPGSAGVGAVGVTGADWYTPGATAQVSFRYYAPGEADPVLGAYKLDFTDPVTGFHSSGIKLWGVEADGTAGFNTGTKIAFQAQHQRNPLGVDVADTQYGNVHIVPTPGVLGLLGLAGIAAGRRRR